MGEKQERTAAEILEENALEMAATRFVAKRFKDAIRRDRQWTSKSVDVNTAKEVAVTFNSQGDAKVHLYVTLTPKGKEPIRVYAPEGGAAQPIQCGMLHAKAWGSVAQGSSSFGPRAKASLTTAREC